MNAQDLYGFSAGPQNHFATCPCAANPYISCSDYLEFLTKYYQAGRSSPGTHITPRPLMHQNQLLWAYFEPQDFILCPNDPDRAPIMTNRSRESRRSQGSSRPSGRNNIPPLPLGKVMQQKNQKGGAGSIGGHFSGKVAGLQNLGQPGQWQPPLPPSDR